MEAAFDPAAPVDERLADREFVETSRPDFVQGLEISGLRSPHETIAPVGVDVAP